ncbi:FecR domain-containing protein [uncultured Chitinophaga sp.]|jgi:Fe2+-dicitrate sensor, membrane component|uniref:FecR family protein n=1 Tax=uncultured Chitinophaga sp. TaxID=339340 RepID=UPI00261B06EF|nr:FecR domain-containing protein [uncultured Chitinophaga sp.]
MECNKEHIRELLIEKFAGTISEADNALIESAIRNDLEILRMWEEVQHELGTGKGKAFFNRLDDEQAWQQVAARFRTSAGSRRSFFFPKKWMAVAAVCLPCLFISWWYFRPATAPAAKPALAVKMPPGVQLTLAGGASVNLSDTAARQLNIGATALNIQGNKLRYASTQTMMHAWNTLIVPARLDYKIVLEDGTEVWLNAATTLRFPFSFSTGEREVYLAGEAFFKVAKDARRPFIVHTGKTSIRVLGTSFNINAYDDHITTLALVDGKVITKAGNQEVSLIPGQQAIYRSGPGFETKRFDPAIALAWMQGIRYFHNAPLGEITRMLPRWFDVNVVFDDPALARQTFSGSIEKNKPLETFLTNLEITSGVQYYFSNGTLHFK